MKSRLDCWSTYFFGGEGGRGGMEREEGGRGDVKRSSDAKGFKEGQLVDLVTCQKWLSVPYS